MLSLVDFRCAVRIFSNADTDTETWYGLWEATVALNAMCVRSGKNGTAARLGECPHFDSKMGGNLVERR